MTKATFLEKRLESVKTFLADFKTPITASLIAGLLSYIFIFTNKLPNHDDAFMMFNKGIGLESGRWGLSILSMIFPDFSMPWIYGIFAVVFISLAVCVIVKMFDIKSKVIQATLAALIVSFPSLATAFSYMFFTYVYALAFLLAVLAAYFVSKRGVFNYIIAVALLGFTLSVYQGFISVAAGLLLVYLVKELVSGEITPKSFILNCLRCLVFLIITLGVYLGVTFIIFAVTGEGFGRYAQNNFAVMNEPLFKRFLRLYSMFKREIFDSQNGLINGNLCRILNIILLLVIAVEGVMFLVRKNAVYKKLFFVLIAFFFPPAINGMYLITEPKGVHTLVVYGFVTLYVLAAVLAENILPENYFGKNILKDILAVAMTGIVLINVYYANEAYLRMNLAYQNTFSFYTSLASQIENNPDFKKGMKVAVVGKENENLYDFSEFKNIDEMKGIRGAYPGMYSKGEFFKLYIGLDVEFASRKEQRIISRKPTFRKMPVYPYYGSIRKIGNYMVVKLEQI